LDGVKEYCLKRGRYTQKWDLKYGTVIPPFGTGTYILWRGNDSNITHLWVYMAEIQTMKKGTLILYVL
jgi:hypothetical protein